MKEIIISITELMTVGETLVKLEILLFLNAKCVRIIVHMLLQIGNVTHQLPTRAKPTVNLILKF